MPPSRTGQVPATVSDLAALTLFRLPAWQMPPHGRRDGRYPGRATPGEQLLVELADEGLVVRVGYV